MGALVDFYGLEDVRGNDRAALLYIMEHLDDLNNPQVVYREFMEKSAHGWLHAEESRDTILCKWVVLLAEAGMRHRHFMPHSEGVDDFQDRELVVLGIYHILRQ